MGCSQTTRDVYDELKKYKFLDNLVLSTELTKEIRKVTFRALALRRSESRNCGLRVVYIQKDGATLLVGAW